MLRSGQAICPVGSYCALGTAFDCPAGRYGRAQVSEPSLLPLSRPLSRPLSISSSPYLCRRARAGEGATQGESFVTLETAVMCHLSCPSLLHSHNLFTLLSLLSPPPLSRSSLCRVFPTPPAPVPARGASGAARAARQGNKSSARRARSARKKGSARRRAVARACTPWSAHQGRWPTRYRAIPPPRCSRRRRCDTWQRDWQGERDAGEEETLGQGARSRPHPKTDRQTR